MFTADGDMRQALNNLQATFAGFTTVNADNVYKVCDQPHPLLIADMINKCVGDNENSSRIEDAIAPMMKLHEAGYAATDIITSVFRVCKQMPALPEYIRLEFIREIGFVHMRIAEGLDSLLQLVGLIAKLCTISEKCRQG